MVRSDKNDPLLIISFFGYTISAKNFLQRFAFEIAILRYKEPFVENGQLENVLSELHSTVYQRPSYREWAPNKTDCLTSVHYLFKKVFGLTIPVCLIGDMPRSLASKGWEFKVISETDLQQGDLLFLKRIEGTRLVAHVAFALDNKQVFHCTEGRGAVKETVTELFQKFEQKRINEQLRYIDPRNFQSSHLIQRDAS